MNLIELELFNICECKQARLKFPVSQKCPLYLVRSNKNCEVITLALQLICGVKYSSFSALHEIREKISNGKVKLTFSLPKPTSVESTEGNSDGQDHESDSDAPCTSWQAHQRLQRRLERNRKKKIQQAMVVTACRDLASNPDMIVYTVDGGPILQCSVIVFQIRFFTCTDIIFPRLKNISHGEYCNGRWLDFLSTEFIDKGSDGNSLLREFCRLYAQRKISENHVSNEFTKSVLSARSLINNSRISHLINIFNDIRWLFEYMTCSEFTVWFLLPTVFGNLQDISKITTENTNFDLMRTEIQLKKPNATPFPWTRAEKHVQELLLVAVQLAFGYHCQQNIIYLHSLNFLEKHQRFEFLNYSLIQSSSSMQLLFEKNYFQRIFYACSKLNICCIIECCCDFHIYPLPSLTINCYWLDSSREWKISIPDCPLSSHTTSDIAQNFLQQFEAILK